MKYLNDYTEEATSAALKKAGAFFAFSDKQFDEAKKEGVNYTSLGMGLICPKENAKQLLQDISDTVKNGIKLDIEENGEDGIIARELRNHEAFYTCDISDTVNVLSAYGFSTEKIASVFNSMRVTEEA